ncbi:unnamed protein product, partial [Rotaria magnacalcarata]
KDDHHNNNNNSLIFTGTILAISYTLKFAKNKGG